MMETLPVQDFATVASAILIGMGVFVLLAPAGRALSRRAAAAAALLWPPAPARPASSAGLAPASAATAGPPVPDAVPDEPLSSDARWDRVAGVLSEAIERAETVRTLQSSAGQQLDSATYAIQRLWAELSSVVPAACPASDASRAAVDVSDGPVTAAAQPVASAPPAASTALAA